MNDKKRAMFDRLLEKTPWGVIASGCAIYVFYALVGLIAAYIVFGKVAEQTNDTVGFLDSWWQVLLFVTVIIVGIAMIGALVMFILREIERKKKPVEEERELSQEELAESDVCGKAKRETSDAAQEEVRNVAEV